MTEEKSVQNGSRGPAMQNYKQAYDRDVERLLLGVVGGPYGAPGSRMFHDPETAFGLISLGLQCVPVADDLRFLVPL